VTTQDLHAYLSRQLDNDIDLLVAELARDEGKMASMAYDTAWVARLAPHHADFEAAMVWLRQHQRADGSWGAEFLHYHDRIISTLAALIALREAKSPQDRDRIAKAESYLWRHYSQLYVDANDTIGFPLLTIGLSHEAQRVGVDVPPDLYRDMGKLEKKLNMLGYDPATWRYTTLSLSLESLQTYIPEDARASLIEADGSVASSPAATAGTLLHLKEPPTRSIDYLRQILKTQGDNGVPFVTPFTSFEAIWALAPLWLSGALRPESPEIQRVLAYIKNRWQTGHGITFSDTFQVPDLDDTTVGYLLLLWGGYDMEPDFLELYEDETHFRCYPGELDLSMSVNLRALHVISRHPEHPRYTVWSQKVQAMIRRHHLNGTFWFDKWHISPYYLICFAVLHAHGWVDDILENRIRWILRTQHLNGGWGYHHDQPTAEETAYCLLSLIHWNRHVSPIEPDVIHAAAQFITAHLNEDHPALWIGKALYNPYRVVRATLLAALFSYRSYLGDAQGKVHETHHNRMV